MLATIALDLTQAIIAGVLLSLMLFLKDSAKATVSIESVDWDKVGVRPPLEPITAKVLYITGSLFFGSVNQIVEFVESQPAVDVLILSMRGVPMVDVSSVQAIEHIWREQVELGGELYVTGMQPQVRNLCERAGLIDLIGEDHVLWSADRAIEAAAKTPATHSAVQVEPFDDGMADLPFGVVAAG
jgi:SulP family sulfate permease